jgi:hypothetical protein
VPGNQSVSYTQLDERCRTASDAYQKAASALHAGLCRPSGATASEWKAEYDARVDLRVARAAYVSASLDFTAVSAAEHKVSKGGLGPRVSKAQSRWLPKAIGRANF